MIVPLPLSIIPGSVALMRRTTANTFVSNWRFHSSSLTPCTGPQVLNPALFTSTSMGPTSLASPDITRATSSSLFMSISTPTRRPPSSDASRSMSSSRLFRRLVATTTYPLRARCRAVALPMPAEAPVMSTVLLEPLSM